MNLGALMCNINAQGWICNILPFITSVYLNECWNFLRKNISWLIRFLAASAKSKSSFSLWQSWIAIIEIFENIRFGTFLLYILEIFGRIGSFEALDVVALWYLDIAIYCVFYVGYQIWWWLIISYYKIQYVCLSVRHRLPSYAYYGDGTFTDDSIGLH